MPLKIFYSLILILPLTVAGQSVETKVETKKETLRIEGINTSGYQVVIAAPEEEVKSSLSRFLKSLGKIKPSGDYITLADPVVNGRKLTGMLYAATKHQGDVSVAWIGFPSANEQQMESAVEKLTFDFGVTFHREKIQVQVDESLRALQAVEKLQLRLANQNKDLKNRVESNKREKIELEKSLVQNKIELGDLTKRLAGNEKAQDSVAIATEQIRKVVEMHTERQRKVH